MLADSPAAGALRQCGTRPADYRCCAPCSRSDARRPGGGRAARQSSAYFAADFFVADFFACDFFAADFAAADFFAADFPAAGFLAADFPAAGFPAADFLAADFLAAGFPAADFLAARFIGFFTADLPVAEPAAASRAPASPDDYVSSSACASRSSMTSRRNRIMRFRCVFGVALHFPLSARRCATLSFSPASDVV
jgi:hypothetical protein